MRDSKETNPFSFEHEVRRGRLFAFVDWISQLGYKAHFAPKDHVLLISPNAWARFDEFTQEEYRQTANEFFKELGLHVAISNKVSGWDIVVGRFRENSK